MKNLELVIVDEENETGDIPISRRVLEKIDSRNGSTSATPILTLIDRARKKGWVINTVEDNSTNAIVGIRADGTSDILVADASAKGLKGNHLLTFLRNSQYDLAIYLKSFSQGGSMFMADKYAWIGDSLAFYGRDGKRRLETTISSASPLVPRSEGSRKNLSKNKAMATLGANPELGSLSEAGKYKEASDTAVKELEMELDRAMRALKAFEEEDPARTYQYAKMDYKSQIAKIDDKIQELNQEKASVSAKLESLSQESFIRAQKVDIEEAKTRLHIAELCLKGARVKANAARAKLAKAKKKSKGND